MSQTLKVGAPPLIAKQLPPGMMEANVFRGPDQFGLEEKPIPTAGPGEAVIQVRLPWLQKWQAIAPYIEWGVIAGCSLPPLVVV